MSQGTIVRVNLERGFGFVKADTGGQDLFFHASAPEGVTFVEVREGQRVAFAQVEDPRNPGRGRAEAVRLTGD
jgi:CspA family cold shock protein